MSSPGRKKSPSNSTKSKMIGQPERPQPSRKGAYLKLIYRFYEPLIFLEALGSTRGHHTPIPHQNGTPEFAQRRYLDNLSYLCDFDKGGPTTTAIGLEERPECFQYWVASNKKSAKVLGFLQRMLESLKQLSLPGLKQPSVEEEQILRMCVDFSRARIVKESKFLNISISNCRAILLKESGPEARSLLTWLNIFTDRDHLSLCQVAYDHRKDVEMKFIEHRVRSMDETSPNDSIAFEFETLRHHIGRLGHHIRAVKQVIEDSQGLQRLFDEYTVSLVPALASVPRPEVDSKTTLEGILNRMSTTAGSPLEEKLLESLKEMNRTMPLLEKIHEKYADEKFIPAVHAEIQVLEHFYKGGISFANGDRYIGCSKPACFCCHLYIQNHPLRCVVPQSHKKVYFHWGPPLLIGGDMDNQYPTQRNVLNAMLLNIRKEVVDQISRKLRGFRWHPDSITNITVDTRSVQEQPGQLITLEEGLRRLSLGYKSQTRSSTDDAGSEGAPSLPGSSTWSNGHTTTRNSSPNREIITDDEYDSDGGAALSD